MAPTPQDQAGRIDRRALVPDDLSHHRRQHICDPGVPCARVGTASAYRQVKFAAPLLRFGSHRTLFIGCSAVDAKPERQAPGIEGSARRPSNPCRPDRPRYLEEPHHKPGRAALCRVRSKTRKAVRKAAMKLENCVGGENKTSASGQANGK